MVWKNAGTKLEYLATRKQGVSMQEVTVEPALGEKLGQLAAQTVLCDPEGRVLGLFLPYLDRPKLKDFQLEPPSTIEEINERRKNRSGKPLEEILSRLGFQ
jgi:hypothetical protein